MRFTKMQGCGNDYIYVNCFAQRVTRPDVLARRISDRHFGVGADGLILIEPSEDADAFMHMFNADGSEGSMCGNGIRCTAKYLYDHGLVPSTRRSVRIDTRSGPREISFRVAHGRATELTVDMGTPHLTGAVPEAITVAGMALHCVGVDMGNPHAVYFLDDNPALAVKTVRELALARYGSYFETHPRFPERVNSEFIEVLSPAEVNFRVWERGSGETLACGTGAAAAVFAGIAAGKLQDAVLVHLSGGDLRVRCDAQSGHCFLSGGAEEVFSGDYPEADAL
ncbi:MAG: diaminopimelate epimerase [Oscillospiraceae bacterium]|nr:diaminopimelate epimerase [Oscillospiraceae bacterium]